MAQLVIPSGVLVRLVWGGGGTATAINVFGARKSGASAIDQTLTNTLGAAIKATFTSSGLAAVSNGSFQLMNIGVRDVSAPSLPEFVDAGAPVTGTAAGGKALPPQLAACITLRTAKAGKSYRGRSYVPMSHDSALSSGGAMTAAAQTAAVAFVTGVRTNFTSNGLTMAILSRKQLSSEDVTLVQSRDLLFETIRGRAVAGV